MSKSTFDLDTLNPAYPVERAKLAPIAAELNAIDEKLRQDDLARQPPTPGTTTAVVGRTLSKAELADLQERRAKLQRQRAEQSPRVDAERQRAIAEALAMAAPENDRLVAAVAERIEDAAAALAELNRYRDSVPGGRDLRPVNWKAAPQLRGILTALPNGAFRKHNS